MSAPPPLTIKQHLLVREALAMLDQWAAQVRSRWRRFGAELDYDDLRSVGKLALYDAVTRYREERNSSFARYAKLRVWGAMIDAAVANTSDARIVRAMIRARCYHMADYNDDFNVMKHDQGEMHRRVDSMCDAAAAVMFAVGVETIARERERDLVADTEENVRAIAALDEIVGDLPDDDRQLLDLLFGHGFDQHKVGDILGITHETVCRRLRRLRENLKRLLRIKGIDHAPPPVQLAGLRPVLKTPDEDREGRWDP